MDQEEAKKFLAQEKLERSAACRVALQNLLNEHKCTIEPQVILKPNAHPHIIVNITALDK